MWKSLMVATLLTFLLAGCTGETLIGFIDAGPDTAVVDASADVPWDLGPNEAGATTDLIDATPADISSDGKACVSGWQPMTTVGTNTLYAVWGSGPKKVFAVGAGGTVLVYEGYSWSQVPLAKTKVGLTFHDVWGSSSTNIFIVGSYLATPSTRKGLVLRWDGSKWHESEVSGSGSLELRAIRGKGTTLVQVVGSEESGGGYKPILASFDGSKWTTSDISTTAESGRLNAIWASGPSNIMAVGGACSSGTCNPLYYLGSGTTWTKTTLTTMPPPGFFSGIWGSSATNIFMVGRFSGVGGSSQDRAVVTSLDGTVWSTTYLDKGYGLNGVWGDGQGAIYSVGDKGHILRHAAGGWSLMTSGSIKSLHGVWGSSATDVFAVGEGGTVLHMCSPF